MNDMKKKEKVYETAESLKGTLWGAQAFHELGLDMDYLDVIADYINVHINSEILLERERCLGIVEGMKNPTNNPTTSGDHFNIGFVKELTYNGVPYKDWELYNKILSDLAEKIKGDKK